MKIGVGLPAYIPWANPMEITAWARKAEEMGFSSLGMIDRLIYRNYEPMISLTAAAAVTSRIRLVTSVLLAPLRPAALLAKQAATLDAISGGRLTLGLGIGAREGDYRAVAVPFEHRGSYLAKQVRRMKRIWSGQPVEEGLGVIGPSPAREGGPEILLGGYSPQALRRVGRIADGFIAGSGADVARVKELWQYALQSWQQAGREGKPRFVGAFYAVLGGQGAVNKANDFIRDYYGERPSQMKTSAQEIEDTAQALADLGMDELILWAAVPELDQLDYLAEVAQKVSG